MKLMLTGLKAWARPSNTQGATARTADFGITVVATLLAAVTYAVLR